jgi:hypothetical protein
LVACGFLIRNNAAMTVSRLLQIITDTWCSSGAFDADGNLVQTGGYFEGEKVVRYLSPCANCDWREFPGSFAEGRWCVWITYLHCSSLQMT